MGTHFKGTADEITALDAYIKLMRASSSVSGRIHSHLTATGLTVGQFGVIEALYHLGPLSQHVIGKKLLKTGGNITMIIDNLEKRGLIRRKRSPQDRRVIIVSLTGEGERLIGEIFPRHVSRIVDELGNLTASEQKELARLCKKLGLTGAGERSSATE